MARALAGGCEGRVVGSSSYKAIAGILSETGIGFATLTVFFGGMVESGEISSTFDSGFRMVMSGRMKAEVMSIKPLR